MPALRCLVVVMLNLAAAVLSANSSGATPPFTQAIGRWDAKTGERLHDPDKKGRAKESDSAVLTLAFSPDGKSLAVACSDNSIGLWRMPSGGEFRRLRLKADSEFFLPNLADNRPRLTFSADGKIVAVRFSTLSEEKMLWAYDTIKQWETVTGKALRTLRGEKGEELCVVPDENGVLMAIGIQMDVLAARKGRVRGWDLATGKQRFAWRTRKEVQGCKAFWHFKAFSADASVVVVATMLASGLQGFGSAFACHDAGRGQLLCEPDTGFDLDSPLALSADGRTLAMADTFQGRLTLWDTRTGQKLYPLENASDEEPPAPIAGGTSSLAFSPDGKTLAIASKRGIIYLWETATAGERGRFTGHLGAIPALAFSADGRLLASGGKDGIVRLWDATLFPQRQPAERLTASQVQTLWDQLADKDAARAYRAICRLSAAPQQAVPFLKLHLPLLSEAENRRIQRLLVDLDSAEYTVRANAEAELAKFGGPALPILSRALAGKPALEVRRRVESLVEDIHKSQPAMLTGERLRYVRGVEVLEHSGTAEAKEILRLLTERASDPRLWQEAKTASRRLARSAAGTR
jgi:WD40 repeat protein